MYKYYITVNEMNRIVDGFSSAFRTPSANDICIGESSERQFTMLNQINPPLVDEDGCHLYKYTSEHGSARKPTRTIRRCNLSDIREEKTHNIEFFKKSKIEELQRDMNAITEAGIDIQTSRGLEHFTLGTQNRFELTTLYSQMMMSNTGTVKYYSDDSICREYTRDEFNVVALTAQVFISNQTTLFNHLREYVKSCKTYEELEAIKFSVDSLPEDLQKSYYVAISHSA